jgi:hypothetical protein
MAEAVERCRCVGGLNVMIAYDKLSNIHDTTLGESYCRN